MPGAIVHSMDSETVYYFTAAAWIWLYELSHRSTKNHFFKALGYLFSLAVRSHGDMPFKTVLDIDLQDISLLSPPSPFAGMAIQSAAEQALFDFIEASKKTMYGYREDDFK